ncbi:phosphatidate cytidylyltransferase [Candidatus Pelagibacter sp.]|nr:phosphatidate cytidylyltransferase [Candidatus Pelagibacter sp.]
MSLELKKRIITSLFLLFLLTLMFFYTYILIILLIIITIIAWVEFYALVSKIFVKNNFNTKLLRFIYKSTSLLYLSFVVGLILMVEIKFLDFRVFIIYSILVSILSDIGGLIIGKMFKGKKLTKISPKKTISGSIGSFAFSLMLIPFFLNFIYIESIFNLVLITILISLTSQIGDLFISYLKRKAKVKDTSDLLPGHGGLLDRIDGIIFSIPMGLLLFNIF